jgi:flagellar motor switch protein FliM
MSGVLDNDEMEALKAAETPTQKAAATRDVQQVQLIGQDHRLRSALAAITQAHNLTQENIERMFVKLRQNPQKVDLAPVEVSGPRALAKLVEEAAAVCLLEPPGGGDFAYLLLDAPLAFEITDRGFGGDGVASPEDLAVITPLMKTNACELASGLCHFFEEARGDLWPTLRVNGPAVRLDGVLLALSEREAVVMRWMISEPNTTITLIIPASLLNITAKNPNKPSDESSQRRLLDNLSEVSVEIRVELGSATISMAQLMAIQPGDVLKLRRGTAEPLRVHSDVIALFDVKPNAVGDHIGLVLEHWLE